MILDEHQRAAVETTSKKALVVAGPGSGKTRVLVERARFMVEELKRSPGEMVVITFTRMAAGEIRERLGESVRPGFLGTIHAFCLNVLMTYGQGLGYQADWLTVLDEEEVQLDEREILSDAGLIRKMPRGKWKWVKVKASEWKLTKEGLLAGELDLEDVHEDLKTAWLAYIQRLRTQNVLTFATILWEALNLLQDSQVIRKVRQKFAHFMVDEFQDTDHQQWRILLRLLDTMKPKSLYVVGDADQSIYEWRQADPSIMIKMTEEKDVEVLELVNCYRYGEEIGKVSQDLVKHNSNRIDRRLDFKGPSGKVLYQEGASLTGLTLEIGKAADRHGPEGVAILARNHATLDSMQEILKHCGIACQKLGRLRDLKKSAEFRACVGFLRLSFNPTSWQSFMAVSASLGLSEATVRKVKEVAAIGRYGLWSAYLNSGAIRTPEKVDACNKFVRSKARVNDLMALLAKVDPEGNYWPALEFLERVEYLHGFNNTQELVNWLALASMQDEAKMTPHAVSLATVHAAKGMEWPVVFIIGMNSNLFPSPRSVMEGRLEEERRLFYVGMTRAQRELHVIHCDFCELDVPHWSTLAENSGPSVFVSESGLEKVEAV